CADYATNLLMDLIFDQGDQLSSYPVILCTLLLAWIHTELVSSSSPQALIGLAIRLLILSDYEQTSPWQALMAALIYLDVYSALFYAHTLQQNALWPSFEKPKDKETQWMLLLAQVISLFYHPYTNHIRKVDVDEVLTLVRDMEIQEQTLSDQKQPIQVVHYMIKILLFRPFCMHGEQTLTKSTFLDLSTSAADALSQLLLKEHTPWSKGALLLIQDVLDRVSAEFQDGDTQAQLDRIKKQPASKQKPLSSFLRKLWAIISDPVHEDDMHWVHSGQVMCIPNASLFTQKMLPALLNHNNFQSFVRQLNLYGFRKVLTEETRTNKTAWHFKHPNFQRDYPHKLHDIKRRSKHRLLPPLPPFLPLRTTPRQLLPKQTKDGK
ncbi:hypothetical protein CU098_009976, partial [Rhizopus stolonifer]